MADRRRLHIGSTAFHLARFGLAGIGYWQGVFVIGAAVAAIGLRARLVCFRRTNQVSIAQLGRNERRMGGLFVLLSPWVLWV